MVAGGDGRPRPLRCKRTVHVSQYERLKEEQRDAKKTKWAQTAKTSSADYQTRGKKIGAWYRNRHRVKSGERVYEERYLR